MPVYTYITCPGEHPQMHSQEAVTDEKVKFKVQPYFFQYFFFFFSESDFFNFLKLNFKDRGPNSEYIKGGVIEK